MPGRQNSPSLKPSFWLHLRDMSASIMCGFGHIKVHVVALNKQRFSHLLYTFVYTDSSLYHPSPRLPLRLRKTLLTFENSSQASLPPGRGP